MHKYTKRPTLKAPPTPHIRIAYQHLLRKVTIADPQSARKISNGERVGKPMYRAQLLARNSTKYNVEQMVVILLLPMDYRLVNGLARESNFLSPITSRIQNVFPTPSISHAPIYLPICKNHTTGLSFPYLSHSFHRMTQRQTLILLGYYNARLGCHSWSPLLSRWSSCLFHRISSFMHEVEKLVVHARPVSHAKL